MVNVQRERVDMWLDPLCPWSWVTAEWLLEVQEQRHQKADAGLDIDWHVMSMSILNEGQEIPEEWQEFVRLAWGPVRVLEAAARYDADAFVPVMRGIARRWHVEERRDLPALLAEAVADAGLPGWVADVAWVDDNDEDVRLSHKRAMALGGNDVGSPILGFARPDGEQVGFHGPILSRIPRGVEAVELFGAVRTLATTPGFFELKRTRDEQPWFD